MKKTIVYEHENDKVGYILCQVEGCPRTSPDGQDTTCGLRVLKLDPQHNDPYCGAVATVDYWYSIGVFD